MGNDEIRSKPDTRPLKPIESRTNRVPRSKSRQVRNRIAATAQPAHLVLFVLFLVLFALVWLRLWPAIPLFGEARWPEGLLLVLATATTLGSLARRLPLQNVMLTASIIVIIAGAVQTFGALTAI